MSTKPSESRVSDPQACGLRVAISPERSVLLPFDQFSFSELTHGGKEQSLRSVFSTHEVVVRGHALRRLETVMQRMEFSFITRAPDGSRSLAAESQPVIREIIANAVNPPTRTAQSSNN